MGSTKLVSLGLAGLAAAAVGVAPARGQCRLCDVPTTMPAADSGGAEVSLEIETSLDFDRLVLGGPGQGNVMIRPDGSTATGGMVAEVSPRAMVGSAVVRGEPGRLVRIDLPARIALYSLGGGEISVDQVTSDLPSMPRLDAAGLLKFRFGGRLTVHGDSEGQYHGDLPITVEYL